MISVDRRLALKNRFPSSYKVARNIFKGSRVRGLITARKLHHDFGQLLSMRLGRSVDNRSNPIPWFTYPAIQYLEGLDFTKCIIYEWGSGASTIWWSSRADRVVSIEDDPDWFNELEARVPENCDLKLVSESNYISAFGAQELLPDVVIIDGKDRACCFAEVLGWRSLPHISMIILDNSNWYPRLIESAWQDLRWPRIDFHGFTPINDYTSSTSIWINPHHRNVIDSRQVVNLIGCKSHSADDDICGPDSS